MPYVTLRALALGLAGVLAAWPASPQPSTQQMDLAAKIDCSKFKRDAGGSWKEASGKIYKADGSKEEAGMAVAIEQKCAPKDR